MGCALSHNAVRPGEANLEPKSPSVIADRSSPPLRRTSSLRRLSLTAHYPMHAMHMGTFLGLSTLQTHEACVEYGDVRPLPDGAAVIFVSHQWLSLAHPDPASVQLQRLQFMLNKIVVDGAVGELFEQDDWSAFATGINKNKTLSKSTQDALMAEHEPLTEQIFAAVTSLTPRYLV